MVKAQYDAITLKAFYDPSDKKGMIAIPPHEDEDETPINVICQPACPLTTQAVCSAIPGFDPNPKYIYAVGKDIQSNLWGYWNPGDPEMKTFDSGIDPDAYNR